jgi:hypothetical protein
MLAKHSQAAADSAYPLIVIFDTRDGRIVHLHQVLVLPGVGAPSEDEMEAEALAHARRHSGADPNTMATLRVSPDALRKGVEYKIDLPTWTLVEAGADLNR